MRRRPAGLEAAALVDGDVHQHRAGPHPAHHLSRDQLGRGRARHQHGADHQVGGQHGLLDRRGGGEQCGRSGAELQIEFLQPRQRFVDDGDTRLQPHRHARGVGAGHATAQHDHLGRRHARDAAQQNAGAALLTFQAMGADLHGHAAGDLAHWRQQRQRAGAVGDRLVGDAGGARLHQPLGLRLVGGEMEVGEQDLATPQQGDLGGLRLLDLDDQVGRREHRARPRRRCVAPAER